jgi:hypothetical protein
MGEPTDRQLLELAGRRYNGAGRHENAMREELGLSSTEFWARVCGSSPLRRRMWRSSTGR